MNANDDFRSAASAIEVDPPPSVDIDTSGRFSKQFSIAHILLWTFCSAMLMAIDQFAIRMHGAQKLVNEQALGWGIARILRYLVVGLALSGFVTFFLRRIKRVAARVQPGEWLLVAQTVGCLATAIRAVTGAIAANTATDQQLFLIKGGIIAEASVGFFAFMLPALLYRQLGMWRRFFVLAALTTALSAVANIHWVIFNRSFGDSSFMWLAFLVLAANVLLFTIAVILDIHRKTPRGWLHWLGVGTFLLMQVYWMVTVAIALSR